jgi:GTP pyrophosphokinase
MLADISSAISEYEVNITGAQIKTTGDGNAESTFDIEIGNLKQLKKVINSLHKIEGVMKVERIRGWQGPGGP